MEGVSVTRLGGVYFGARVCDTIVRGDLLVENVFYDPLRLDGEKPLCDESGGISPQDSNNVLHQIIFKSTNFSAIISQFLHKTQQGASANFLVVTVLNSYKRYIYICFPKSSSKNEKNFPTEGK